MTCSYCALQQFRRRSFRTVGGFDHARAGFGHIRCGVDQIWARFHPNQVRRHQLPTKSKWELTNCLCCGLDDARAGLDRFRPGLNRVLHLGSTNFGLCSIRFGQGRPSSVLGSGITSWVDQIWAGLGQALARLVSMLASLLTLPALVPLVSSFQPAPTTCRTCRSHVGDAPLGEGLQASAKHVWVSFGHDWGPNSIGDPQGLGGKGVTLSIKNSRRNAWSKGGN